MNEASNDGGGSSTGSQIGSEVGGAVGGAVAGATGAAVGSAIGGSVGGWLGSMVHLIQEVGAGAFKVELESLQIFKQRVDAILSDLDGSVAGHGSISRQQLTPGQLGQDFGQAGDLLSAYTKVHSNLEQLSKTLSLQIEAMSATIDMAARGYDNSDQQQRDHFQSTLNQAESQRQHLATGQAQTAQAQVGQPPVAAPAPQGTQQGSF
ncbi:MULTISPECIES: hypothetical protein [Kitasatospora]|uniref:Uncharacterized protein n=1 Tax=Kitasatospora setae (strain ATCC 33774 / DSM 43861 / JCM 3304 / KCC A-0304 / NBRC 14216 / KM-6054) TaxID=452652 RepID=E4NBM1_KITSK|nr:MULTISPECIES: hypothetical protein [Kitasatospora]BAJ28602.1 hypothetical protein KSE_27910 [Kitasatospora setae KM-6054]